MRTLLLALATGLLAAMVLQVLTLIALIVFSLLGTREAATVIPARDAMLFVESLRTVWTSQEPQPALSPAGEAT